MWILDCWKEQAELPYTPSTNDPIPRDAAPLSDEKADEEK
jgi:hypothetical protein